MDTDLGSAPALNRVDECNGSTMSHRTVDIHVVTGIQVCTSKSKRVKGVRLFGLEHGQAASDVFELPNCETWHTRVNCPSGKEAIGVVLHFQSNAGQNTPADLRGIKLICE